MLKLFCRACHKFVKEITPIQAAKLTGNEVCEDCQGRMVDAVAELEKISKRAQFAIQKKADKAKADLEMAMSKVLKKE